MKNMMAVWGCVALLFMGCSLSQFGWKGEAPSKSKSKTPAETNETNKEDFDPLILNDDDVWILPSAKSGSSSKENRIAVPKSKISKEEVVQGYRIQLVATKEEEQAREIKKNAMLKLSHPVYLIFEPPLYKVRVGDCATREEAKEILNEAKQNGFPDAWIVPSMINKTTEETP